ncbi:Intracellular exo-alpha-(1-_5)-L-arabinofuranosidase [Planctomycetes bacterium CA13]|uniref:Intracellular exo-alpha-(1->5)-L-arabinofuranosidase n=1 Tax=Novipirellula herctigrandis TaxID=2527986 RepID=A0A5C5Z001_9BACT|nr:Intracellular exo-alpha-(1->5)-L-arabinofuranosidase [Planctomycetes bacterium CA13]
MAIRFSIIIGVAMFTSPLSARLYGQEAASVITVDMEHAIKDDIKQQPAAANLCWLLTNDDYRSPGAMSFEEAVKELGCGSLRFPYGHLADNYLWHTPPFEETSQGLRPKVAARSQAPGAWDWAIDSEGGFKSAMDFDGYMQLCSKLEIEPLVVVNVFACKYKGGPSYEELKTTAVEWVKYAKRKNYHVAYWQIGNEVDHHKDRMTPKEYVDCYLDFVKVMKEVDPSIRVGPGILSSTSYFDAIVSRSPDLIDFVSCHQYMYAYQKKCASYTLWKQCDEQFIPNVEKMQHAVTRSANPEMEIVITETGVTPANETLGRINNTYKALWWFEVLMNELAVKNVSYVYYWGAHSPWSGPRDSNSDVGVLLRVDSNERKPTGEIVRLVNRSMLQRMLECTRVSGDVRAYATADATGRQLNLFLLNKNTDSEQVAIKLRNDSEQSRTFQRTVFLGKSPDDRAPVYETSPSVRTDKDAMDLQLPPLSITFLNQTAR